jgi:hypothetical protein
MPRIDVATWLGIREDEKKATEMVARERKLLY